MMFAPEIYTEKFEESVRFYRECLGFKPKQGDGEFQDMEGFAVLVHRDNPAYELYICVPNSPGVDKIFWPAFHGQGLIFQMIVDDVDAVYKTVKEHGGRIVLDMIEDPGNGRHFAVEDPNKIIIDVAQF